MQSGDVVKIANLLPENTVVIDNEAISVRRRSLNAYGVVELKIIYWAGIFKDSKKPDDWIPVQTSFGLGFYHVSELVTAAVDDLLKRKNTLMLSIQSVKHSVEYKIKQAKKLLEEINEQQILLREKTTEAAKLESEIAENHIKDGNKKHAVANYLSEFSLLLNLGQMFPAAGNKALECCEPEEKERIEKELKNIINEFDSKDSWSKFRNERNL